MRVLELVDGVGSATGLAALARKWAQDLELTNTGDAASPLAALTLVDITAESVLSAARNGDETSLAIVDRLGDRLAQVCFVLASLLDVERVILVGAIAEAAGPIIDRARIVLAENFYAPIPEIAASELGADAVVIGAIQRGLALVQANPLGLVLAGLPLTVTESVNL
jgi:predicted NBD/HSP70 family sugar kinase